ncbi:MAG: DUF2478 domain-containing protein [Acetobacteraceae bacterium]|nr:DUF2478 domain-containing protein [Acetobacteraceae bacterium]
MTNQVPTATRQPASFDLTAKVGVLLYNTSIEIEAILEASVDLIREQGVRVAGLMQHFGDVLPNGKRSMWLEDILTAETVRLDVPRGSGTVACVLDPDALAQAACMLQRAATSGADLIVVNRFGNAEADGSGLRAEIAEAICSGIAVLIPVRFSLLHDLEGFLGSAAPVLLPSPAAIADWAKDVVGGASGDRQAAADQTLRR